MRKQWNIVSDAGTLMIEALAMLALISMVTPILYKKAAERTLELQDINAASQMRVMSKALDDYIRDNFADITGGRTVVNNCGGTAGSVDYSGFVDGGKPKDEASKVIPVEHLCDYLPYGFLDSSGKVNGSRTFEGYNVAIALKTATVQSQDSSGATIDKDVSRLTGFILAQPQGELPLLRASRISSMIGSNGGYVQDGNANGVQGVWKIDNIKSELFSGAADIKVDDGAIVTSSVQPISDGSSLNENVLYRKEYPGRPDLNTMETTLNMGGNDIEDIHKLIVSGEDLGTDDAALEIEHGGIDIKDGGLDIGDGKFEVDGTDGSFSGAGGNFQVDGTGNTSMGNANINGDAAITGGATVGGDISVTGGATIGGPTVINNTLQVDDNAEFGKDVNIAGNLTVAGDTTLNGPTTINNNLHVTGDTTLDGPTTINNTLHVTGDATFDSNVDIGGDLTVEGILRANDFRSKTLHGGLIGYDWADNPDNDRFGFTAIWAQGNPANSYVWAGPNNEMEVTLDRVTLSAGPTDDKTGFELTPGDITMGADTISLMASNDLNKPELQITPDRTSVNRGQFVVNTWQDAANPTGNAVNQIETNYNYVHFMKTNDEPLLSVSDDASTDKGGVHVRKGVLEVKTIRDADNPTSLDEGYVKADRFVDNYVMDVDAAMPRTNNDTGYSANPNRYSQYQVNPAYTSVMHDIKLTSRGGSRLSDILPDFINKGIYVVDNTYTEDVPYWGNLNVSVKGNVVEADGVKTCTSHTCWTSPWLGIIPAPQCPPGYARVVTITPAGWAMGQAGVPGILHDKRQDLWTPSYPYNPADPEDPSPLYFQKSTWLRANVYPHGSKQDFLGWSAIMGFMYPYTYYKEYIDDLGGEVDIDKGSVPDNQLVVWNLFPVLKRQLEAYVTVYCYFDRNNSRYSSEYVDQYDQLNNFRKGWSKNSDYVNRLNDASQTYNDPW